MCRMLSFVKNSITWVFGNFFKFSLFALSCFYVMWMLIPHPSFYCSNFRFSIMIPLDDLLNISSRSGQIAIFFGIFFNCTFSPGLCGGIKDKVDSFLLQSLWTTGNLTCWCILTTWRNGWILVIICWFSSFWLHFDLRFPGIFLGTQGRNGLKFGLLMYSYHLQNRLDFGQGMLLFLILAPFWLSEAVQIWGFRDFL